MSDQEQFNLQESKEDKFKRLGNSRLTKALDAIALLESLSNQQAYEYTEEQAQIIARAQGGRGPNTEYLWNTAAHLAQMGLRDPDLDWLADRVRQLRG